MKIIHVTHCYHPSKGGVQWWFKNVSERLVNDYGDNVTVVTTNSLYGPERDKFQEVNPSSEIVNGVKVIRFPYQRWHISPMKFVIKSFRKFGLTVPDSWRAALNGPLSSSMKNYLLENEADAFCASSSNYNYMQLPLWKNCNFLYFGSIHLHENNAYSILTATQKKSIDASKFYIANTAFEKKKIVEAGISAEKIKVLGVGVDEKSYEVDEQQLSKYRRTLFIDEDAIVIAYVGRIERTKNVQILLDAFAQMAPKQPNLYLLIAGAGSDYAAELQASSTRLPKEILDRIKWQINFKQSEKALLFNSIDVLVLPSNNESFGIVFLEAWVCKKPVIGASIGAVKDVIANNEDGLLMEVNDVESLRQKINILISNSSLRKTMGEKGHQKVLENYTWNIITKKLRACYLENCNVHQSMSTSHV